MAYNFGASPQVKSLPMKSFRGVDFANNDTQVHSSRSPDAKNIISDLAGKPVKRSGYETLVTLDAQINGIFRLATEDVERFIVHAGTKLYEWNIADNTSTEIYSDMNDLRSTAFQNDEKLYLLDGKTYLVYGEFDGEYAVKKVSDVATVPMCFLAMNPDGTGGAKRHDLNVLTNKRTYSFIVMPKVDTSAGTEGGTVTEVTEFHLTADDSMKLADDAVTARVLGSDGKWADKAEGTDFTVDREKGIITFSEAIGVTPSTGVDNVEITFAVKPEEDADNTADLINKCTIAIQYGYNGATDRAFVSGNPDAVNFHYWSDINDPTYFPALNYAYLGQDSSAIMGYSIIGDALAVHKEDNEQDQTVFLVRGSYDATNGYQFAISGSVAGVGAISKYCFKRLGTEPMFLSSQGVYALTTQYLTAERYAQNRSYYVNPRLIEEEDLSEAVAVEYNGYYYLAVNGRVYVADSRQKNYERNAPQSEFQYEWYYLTNIDARIWWEYDGRLYFGTADGKVKRFKQSDEYGCYTDDGEAIHAYWDSPIVNMDTLARNKTLKNFFAMIAPYNRSSVDIYYRVNGAKKLIKVKSLTTDIFSFGDVDFRRFSFNIDDFPMVVATNTKAKKFMQIQVRIENNVAGEGFGFYEMEFSYIIVGKYKG